MIYLIWIYDVLLYKYKYTYTIIYIYWEIPPREVNEIIGAYVDQENLEKAIRHVEFE